MVTGKLIVFVGNNETIPFLLYEHGIEVHYFVIDSMHDFQKQLDEKEQQLSAQLDRLYAMLRAGDSIALLQVEYRRVVERMTEKYQILIALLETQRTDLTSAQYEDRLTAIRKTYQSDLLTLAAALDDAVAHRPVT